MFVPSEPYKISEPPKRYPRARVDGVVHEKWRAEATRFQMSCGLAAENYDTVPDDEPLTCIWCVTRNLPWLRWTPDNA